MEAETTPGLWVKCVHCEAQLTKKELEENMMVCPLCEYHFRINAKTRISQLFDEGSFEELNKNIKPTDPLEFVDTVSISLNAPNAARYNEVSRPVYGEDAFDAILKFAQECKEKIPVVKFSVVDVINNNEIEECQRIADSMGITLRIRKREL